VTANGIQEQTTLATDQADLDSDDLLLPEGTVTAELPSDDAFAGVAVKDPGHLVRFGENAGRQASPDQFGQYEQGLQQLKSQTGVDLHVDLLGQMEDLSVGFLDFLQGLLNGIGETDDLTLSIEGSGDEATYLIKQGGSEIARFAVSGDSLVGSVGPRGDLPSPTQGEPISGASGALVLQLSLGRISELPGVEPGSIDPLAREILASLGTLTESFSETTDAIEEKAALDLGSE
jgi:hypothetical protein